ncbi:MAG: hypothetical protein ACI9QD_001282 [Thermoproteota archaeon]|jgi:hypothetical protein
MKIPVLKSTNQSKGSLKKILGMSILTPRAYSKFKITIMIFCLWVSINYSVQLSIDFLAPYEHSGIYYNQVTTAIFDKGTLMEYTNKEEFCHR